MSSLHTRLKNMLATASYMHAKDPLVNVGSWLSESVDDLPEEEFKQAIDNQGGLSPELGHVTDDGFGIIHLSGTMLNDGTDFYPGAFVTYGALDIALAAMEADRSVHTIVYDIASGGGAAAGCFESCARISAATKTTIASIGLAAYSAAYAFAASCDQVWASPTSGSGSVGVVLVHMSFEKLLDDFGVDVSLLHAGARKVDLNPFKKLDGDALEAEMKQIDHLYGMFTKLVADSRFGGDEAPVRATEAGTFLGTQGIDVGFVDFMGDINAVLRTTPSTVEQTSVIASSEAPEPQAVNLKDQPNIEAIMAELETLGMTAQLYEVIQSGVAVEDIAEFLGYNREVSEMCRVLGVPDKASGFISNRTSVGLVREAIMAELSNEGVQISSGIEQPNVFRDSAAEAGVIDSSKIYARRRAK